MVATPSSAFLTSASVTLLAVVVMLFADARKLKPLRGVMKAVAVMGFMAAALSSGLPSSRTAGVTLAALAFCGIGDLLLIPSGAKRSFLLGLFSFLLGHLGFLVAFVTQGIAWSVAAMALLLLVPVVALVARWLMPYVEAKMKVPVLVYVAVITLMVSAAAGSVAAGGHWLGLVAAVAFFLSDLSVARERFVSDTFLNKVWGAPLYFGAQLAFAAWIFAR